MLSIGYKPKQGLSENESLVNYSLKEYTGNSVSGVLTHVSKAERQIANAGLSNVDVYVNAKNISMDELIDFAEKDPLINIPNQGFIKNIYVQTKDGWIWIH